MKKNSRSKKRQVLTFRQIMGWGIGLAFLIVAVLLIGPLGDLLNLFPSKASTEQRSVTVSSSEVFELGTFDNVEAVADNADGRLQLIKNQAASGGGTTAYDPSPEGKVKVAVAPPSEVDFLFRANQGEDMSWPANEGLSIEMNLINRSADDVTIDFTNSLNRELILYKDSAISQNEIWRYSNDVTHTEDAQQAILPSGMSFFDAQDSIVFIQETMATTGFLQALNVMRDMGQGTYFIKGEIGQYTSSAIMLNMVDSYAYADLIPTSVIFEPSTVTVGQPVTAIVTIKNDSSVQSENSFLTDLTYQILGNRDSKRTVVSERHVHLTANGKEVIEINFTAPTLPGTYDWSLRADIGGERKDILAGIHNDVLEAWEHNNYFYSAGEGGSGDPLIVVPEDEPTDEYVNSGTYISHILDLTTDIVSLDNFLKGEDLPTGASLVYSFRTSDDTTNWSDWTANLADVPVRRYFQVKVDFATTDTTVTPALMDYEVRYTITMADEPKPGFNMSAGPARITQGTTGTSDIDITPLDGFTGPITLTVSGLPDGVELVGFSPNPVSFTTNDSKTSVMTLSVGADVPPKDYEFLIVTGTTDTWPPRLEPLILTVLAAGSPDFTLSANPTTLNIKQSETGTSVATIVPLNNFTDTVGLSFTGLPAGITASFSSADITVAGTSTITFNVGADVALDTYTSVLVGTAGDLTHNVNFILVILAGGEEGGDFTITATPSVLNLTAGEQGSASISINAVNDFAGDVDLTVGGGTTGLTATLADASVAAEGNTALSIATEDFMNTQSVTLTITGVSGVLTHSTTVTVNISKVGLALKNFNLKISLEARSDYSTPLLVRIAPYNNPQNIVYATLVQTNSVGEVAVENVGGLQNEVRYYVDVKSPIHLAGERDVTINANDTYDLTFPELKIGDIAGVASYNADFHDNVINSFDLTKMLADWFKSTHTIADLDLDGIVNSFDYRYLIKNWGFGSGRFTD